MSLFSLIVRLSSNLSRDEIEVELERLLLPHKEDSDRNGPIGHLLRFESSEEGDFEKFETGHREMVVSEVLGVKRMQAQNIRDPDSPIVLSSIDEDRIKKMVSEWIAK